jgi:Jacalin-like lectin domain
MRLRNLCLALMIAGVPAPFVGAQEVLRTGLSQGGYSITAGEGDEFDRAIPTDGVLTLIASKYGVGMDSVTLHYEDANGDQKELDRIGGTGGDHSGLLKLGRNDVIQAIEVKSGVRVDSITWIVRNTRTGTERKVTMGGGGGDRFTRIDVPTGHRVIGIYGRADRACLCKVGLLYVRN